MEKIYIELEITNKKLNEVVVKNRTNYISHHIFEEPKGEQEAVLDMSVRDFIKEYLEYYDTNKEEDIDSLELIKMAIKDYKILFSYVKIANNEKATIETLWKNLNNTSPIFEDNKEQLFHIDFGIIYATIIEKNGKLIIEKTISIYDNDGNIVIHNFDISSTFKEGE